MIFKLFITCITIVTVTGCTALSDLFDPRTSEQIEFDNAYAAAEAALDQSAASGMQWRDSAELLATARETADNGDYSAAIPLANEARIQGELAFGQVAENEEFLKRVPYYNPNASPTDDLRDMQGFFHWKFPDLPDEEFANGFYALDKTMRENWLAIEEFPPYLPAVEDGGALWNIPFQNGVTYADCLGHAAVAGNYPRWDRASGQVVTLPMDINTCRERNDEAPFEYGKSEELIALTAYVAYQSRGGKTNITIPKDDPRALAAYYEGKKFYFSRRGQLNMACYQCHFDTAGETLRTNVLGTALGQTSHFPAYRSKWGAMGGIQRRYKGCNKQVRAKPFGFQSEAYRNLEFFHTYMSNGIPLNGPGSRF